MKKLILSIALFLLCFGVTAQTPSYKVQIGVGEDAGMAWTDINPQPTFVPILGTITETHNYFGVFGIQTWAFMMGTQRIEFTISLTDTAVKRYRLRVAQAIGNQVGAYTTSDPVWNYQSTVISTLVHLLNGGG